MSPRIFSSTVAHDCLRNSDKNKYAALVSIQASDAESYAIHEKTEQKMI
jgi:hypothetical protein